MSQNAETVEENAERKKKKKKEKKKKKRWRSAQDPGRARSRPATQAQVAPRPSSLRGEPRSSIWFFFFFFFPSSNTFFSRFFFFSFFSDENVGAALVVFFVFFLNGNRVLETRFPCRRHLEKVPRKRGTIHENRALEARFRSPKSSL